MRGLERLEFVRERLYGEGDSWDRLQAAGFEFLAAAARRESWPSGLRAEAEQIRAALLTIGVADGGVWEADEADVVAISHDLRRFCERVERTILASTMREHRPWDGHRFGGRLVGLGSDLARAA